MELDVVRERGKLTNVALSATQVAKSDKLPRGF